MVGNTIWKAEVPASAHMYQIGKAVGKAAQDLMNLTNVEIQQAKDQVIKTVDFAWHRATDAHLGYQTRIRTT